MLDLRIRCSSLGALVTEPVHIDAHLRTPTVEDILRKTKRSDDEKAQIIYLKERSLSVGAKTQVRMLVKQELFGFEHEVSSKEMEKGKEVEGDAIEVLNRVRGLSLVKNTERRTNGTISGECDLYHAERRRGHDIKCPWSLSTFPIAIADCHDLGYWWQAQGYMLLWDADEWEINYVMMDTPDRLIRFEPIGMHSVTHLPEHQRVTTWLIKRDPEALRIINLKVAAARQYAQEVIAEFDRSHQPLLLAA